MQILLLLLRRLLINWRVIGNILLIGLLKEKVIANVLLLLLILPIFLSIEVLLIYACRVLEGTQINFLVPCLTILSVKVRVFIRAFPGLLLRDLLMSSNVFHHSLQTLFNRR